MVRQGHKQKLAEIDPLPSRRPAKVGRTASPRFSPLVFNLLRRWSKSNLSAADVQDISHSAVLSGIQGDAELEFLASIDADAGHAHRAMLRRYCKHMSLPEPVPIRCQMTTNKDKGVTCQGEVHVLYPHDWMYHLADAYSTNIDELFGLSEVVDFWASANPKNPKLHEHPMRACEGWAQRAVPFVIHGDGASFHERDSLVNVSMKPILGEGGEDAHFLLAAFPKSCTVSATWPEIWRHLAWSFTAAFHNEHPPLDVDGKPWPKDSPRAKLSGQPIFPNSMFGIVWVLCGDLDYFSRDLGMPYHSSECFCWRCKCNRANIPWNDFRPGAAWQTNQYSAADVIAQEHACPIFTVPGVSALSLMLDLMHVGDLGVTSQAISSSLFTIVEEMQGGSRETKFNQVWVHLQTIAKTSGFAADMTKLTLSQILKDKGSPYAHYPILSGVKAAEARHLLEAIKELAAAHQGDQAGKHRYAMLCALSKFYQVVRSGGFHFTREEAGSAKAAGTHFLVHYSWLAKQAMQSGRLVWNVTPKFHFFAHLCLYTEYENPRAFWVYSGESFVGFASRLAHTVLPGRAAHTLTASLLPKYLIGVHLRMVLV